jgi:hypothetical protein
MPTLTNLAIVHKLFLSQQRDSNDCSLRGDEAEITKNKEDNQ